MFFLLCRLQGAEVLPEGNTETEEDHFCLCCFHSLLCFKDLTVISQTHKHVSVAVNYRAQTNPEPLN